MKLNRSRIASILPVLMCTEQTPSSVKTIVVSIRTKTNQEDITEGGHLEKDFDTDFMAEWWYLNGTAILVANDGEKKDIGFFVVLAHQESSFFVNPAGKQLSHMLTFSGFYSDGSTDDFYFAETHVPQDDLDKYIALGTPYAKYLYPDGSKKFNGSKASGYKLSYTADGLEIDLLFQTNIDKTTDQADQPLHFTAYEHSYGTIQGSILVGSKKYQITQGEGYMDHMIPMTCKGGTWPMDMHGWNWFEVTTEKYELVAYAVRGIEDGYNNYSYKNLTLLDKHTGKVIAKYSGDEISINETDWINETKHSRKRPTKITVSTTDLDVVLNAEKVVYYDQSDSIVAAGFVNFMAFQPHDALIWYKGAMEKGSAFCEYLVTDMAVFTPKINIRGSGGE